MLRYYWLCVKLYQTFGDESLAVFLSGTMEMVFETAANLNYELQQQKSCTVALNKHGPEAVFTAYLSPSSITCRLWSQ